MKFLKKYKESLFTVNKEPLTALSKFFLALFVAFSFIILAISLAQQGRTIKPPNKKFGYNCIYFAQNSKKIDIDDFKYQKHINSFGSNKECKTLAYLYKKSYNELSLILNRLREKEYELSNLISKKEALKSQYSNMLLEKIAKQPRDKSILNANANNIKEKLNSLNEQIQKIKNQIDSLKKEARNKDSFKAFKNFLNKKAKIIEQKYGAYARYYSLKVLFSKYLFLVPLFIVVFWLYSYAIKKEKFILAHLLINLLNVVGIFILFYLLEFIYNIIPHTLLQKLYKLLYKLNIIAFANYLSIAFFVIIFALVIKFIQNRAKKQKELKKSIYKFNYIKDGKCPNCGAFRDNSYKFCPSCGFSLYSICKNCKKLKVNGAKYCQECGSADE